MTPVELLLAALVVAAGAVVQGGIGFGMNLLAAPILALIEPRLLPGPAIASAIGLTALIAWRDRAAIDRRGAAFALVGRVPGTALGAALVARIPPRGVAIAVGVAVVAAALMNIRRPRLRPDAPTLLVAGAVSGLAGTVSSVGGPPLAIVYANEPGPVVRGSLSLIFVVGGLMSLGALAAVGDFGRDDAVASVALLVPGLLGFVASKRLAAHLDAGRTRAAVLTVSIVGALTVLLRELL